MTMSSKWFIPSKGPFSVLVIPYQADENGNFQPSDELSLTGVVDSIDFKSKNILENVSGMSSRFKNYVVIENESSIILVEILKSIGRNFLAEVAYGFRYAKVVLTRGQQTWSFLGVIESYEENIRRGKSIGCLSLKQVDIGEENPIYV